MKAYSDIGNILFLADAYGSHVGVTLSTVSNRACGRGAFLPGLRDRMDDPELDVGVRRLRNTLQWFSVNWPEDLEWPADIPRPPAPESTEHANG